MIRRVLFVSSFFLLVACEKPASSPGSPGSSGSSSSSDTAPAAQEGEPCGDGQNGRPKAFCVQGLVCNVVLTSREPGKCRKNYD